MIFFQTLKLSGIKKKAINPVAPILKHSLQELSELLDQAVLQEDYGAAKKIRDEIQKRILILMYNRLLV
jgi:protein-arginine kinase activator protein McsA